MKPYLAILSARFRMLLQYRAAALAGLGTQVFWGLIRVMIFQAFYEAAGGDPPMTLAQVVTYVWLGQATIRLLIWRADPEIQRMIHTGSVAYELARPVDLYGLWLARGVANLTAPTVLRAVPMFVIAMLFLDMQPPASMVAGTAWAVSMVLAALLAASMVTLLNISLLWTLSGQGASTLVPAAMWCLSGMVIPLPMFPDWLQPVLYALPFRGIMDVPFRIYVGHLPPADFPAVFAHQVGWTAGLILVGRWVLARGTRRIVVQGG